MKGPEYLDSRRKRALDVTIGVSVITCALPVAAWLWTENRIKKQPLFFKQKRVGKRGQLFEMWKFETLSPDAEQDPLHIDLLHRPTGNKVDSRVTNARLKFARDSGLNELPQVINVFKREMSFVGPRPQIPQYIGAANELFPETVLNWEKVALSVLPGFFGTDPLHTRDLPIEQFRTTAASDIDYVKNASLIRDFKIVAQAFLGFLRLAKRKNNGSVQK